MPDRNQSFVKQFQEYQSIINASLLRVFDDGECPDLTTEAAKYSLVAGGKRIRPMFMLAVSDMLHVSYVDIMPFACAVEMIHTYSLIHDDLPCMDNDDTRRGLPTCHVKYSEPIALLAGDALLNRAYEIMFTACQDGSAGKCKASLFLANMAGIHGMIGGQTLDIVSEGKKISIDTLIAMHKKKTGGLISASIVIPFFLQNAAAQDASLEARLLSFSEHIGLGFQIKDDLLDVTSTKEALGKSVGKDAAVEKSTFVTLFGLAEAQNLLEEEMNHAHNVLVQIRSSGYDTRFLEDVSHYLLLRKK